MLVTAGARRHDTQASLSSLLVPPTAWKYAVSMSDWEIVGAILATDSIPEADLKTCAADLQKRAGPEARDMLVVIRDQLARRAVSQVQRDDSSPPSSSQRRRR